MSKDQDRSGCGLGLGVWMRVWVRVRCVDEGVG